MTLNQIEDGWNNGTVSDEAIAAFESAWNVDPTKFTTIVFEPGPCPDIHQRQLPRCGRFRMTDRS